MRSGLDPILRDSIERYENGDAAFFNSCLPSRERWRLYGDFRARAAFLDIETTGLSPASSYITLIGVLDSEGYTAFVQGENLADFREAIEKYDLVVTFNGAAFDLPYIEHHFGSLFKNVAHIDLRFPLRRLDLRGGLKRIEARLGVGRPSELSSMDGYDAVLLWQMWREGDEAARDTLIRYNAEDVLSLPALAEIAFNRLVDRLPIEYEPLSSLPRHDVELPYDVDVVKRLKRMRHNRAWF